MTSINVLKDRLATLGKKENDTDSTGTLLVGRLLTSEEVEQIAGGSSASCGPGSGSYSMGDGATFSQTGGQFGQTGGTYTMTCPGDEQTKPM